MEGSKRAPEGMVCKKKCISCQWNIQLHFRAIQSLSGASRGPELQCGQEQVEQDRPLFQGGS